MDERKQRMLLFAVAAVVVGIALFQWGVMPVLSYRDRLESGVSSTQESLERLLKLEKEYRIVRERARAQENAPGKPKDFSLFAFLDDAASKQGIKGNVEFMRPSKEELDSELTKEIVKMRLSEIRLNKLVSYLFYLEKAKEAVNVDRMTVRSPKSSPGVLQVDLIVSTLVE